jgi:uncharacterized membrane protein YozB (DUF420 family)
MSSSAAVGMAPIAPFTRERMERRFYLLAGYLLLIFVAIGFHQFYLHGRNPGGEPVTQQIAPLVWLHGIGMSAWILFLIVQSSLIVSGNRKLHMSLGVGGAVLAATLVLLGLFTAIGSVHYNPDGFTDLGGPRRFLIIPVTDIVGFGVLAGIVLKNRRRAEIHRPMMFLATIFIMTAALFRIRLIRGPLLSATHGSNFIVFAPWVPMLTLGLLLGVLKCLMTRSWDRCFALGWASIAATSVLQTLVANTSAWNHIAGWVTR